MLLLKTPIPEGAIRVQPRGIGYGFVDPKLEATPAAQKQLLRMGPESARAIHAKLRQIALALGIPPQRLRYPCVVCGEVSAGKRPIR